MIISRAPVRLSMGGGGTDLHSFYSKYGGFVLAVSINKYVNILVNKRFQDSIRLSYSRTEIVNSIKDIDHNIFREALKMTGIKCGIEIVSVADVPSNCGLGTSSAFTVALLNGLFAYKKNYYSIPELAESACKIEINILKEPIGKQDQYASAFGGFNAYIFNKDGTVEVQPLKIKEEVMMELQGNLIMFYLKKERSASNILKEQNSKSKKSDKGTIDRLKTIKDIGIITKRILEKGKIDEFGELMHNHWLTKKKLSNKVSDPFIDEVYETGLKNGAVGGKVVGAGGGGFLLFYCPKNKPKLIAALSKFNLSPTWVHFEYEGAKKVFSN